MNIGDEYTCAACGGTFKSDWTDEEAKAEATANADVFRGDPATEIVCDQCYQEMAPPGGWPAEVHR